MGSGTQKSNLIWCPAHPSLVRLRWCQSIVRYSCTRNFAHAVSAVSLMLCLCLPALARDSAPELKELMSARESGLLTDWRIVGPFGLHPSIDFDRRWAPERDHIGKPGYGSRKVEFFQFSDGQVKLPSSLARDGVFYACSQVYLHSAGDWRLFLESAGTLAVFIDGEKVLTRDDRHALPSTSLRSDLTLARGKHRVLVKFLNGAVPFRLAIMAPTGGLRPHPNIPSVHASDSGYASAALHYGEGDFAAPAQTLSALLEGHPSASAHCLLAGAIPHEPMTEADTAADKKGLAFARLSPA